MLIVPRLELVLERCIALLKVGIDRLYRVRDRGRELRETGVLCKVCMDPEFSFLVHGNADPQGQTRSRESAGLSTTFSVILRATSMDFLFLSLSIFNRTSGKWVTALTKKASFSLFMKIE